MIDSIKEVSCLYFSLTFNEESEFIAICPKMGL